MELMSDTGTRAGTIGGTLLSMVPVITSGEIIRTIILATVGALVSYLVSVLLKMLVQRIKKMPLRR
jgi:mannitol-specific phosphotransferase system IIBC component